jgi:hypothetical protein
VNLADPGAQRGGRSCPRDGNDNEYGEGVENTQGSEKGIRKGKRTKDGKGTGNGMPTQEGKGMENCQGKGIVKHTPGRDNLSCSVAL